MSWVTSSLRFGCVGLLAVLMTGVGCQRKFQRDVAKLNDSPLLVDNAMKQRRWEQTNVEYPNGGVPAWSTGMKREIRGDLEYWQEQIFSPAIFVGQVIAMPVVVLKDKPREMRTYRGVVVPPTWHAMPPLEPVQ